MLTRRINGPLNRLQEEMDHVFTNLFGETSGLDPLALIGRQRAFPPLNIWEDAENLYAEAELPGLTMDDLEVIVKGNELTLRGQRREQEQPSVTYHRRERGVGSFQRVVRLPVEIDADHVEASLRNGVLTIKLPKAPSARPRRIEVKTAST